MSEHRIYRFPNWLSTPYKHIILTGNTDVEKAAKAPPTEYEYRLAESLSRSRRLIQEYILCNEFTLFCTFTFSTEKVTDRTDYKTLKKVFSKALNNYRNRYDPAFKYLYIPELHEDGAVHFHGVMTTPRRFLCTPLEIPKKDEKGILRMVPNTPRYMDWTYYSERFGHFSCSWIRDYEKCAGYVSKYMTKDLAAWFSRNDQIVMHTKGLNRPELVHIGEGYHLPGKGQTGDFHGDFCYTGMRDIYDTAPYYVNGDDRWESADYRQDNEWIPRIQYQPKEDGWWYIPETPDTPFYPWFLLGPFDKYEQTTFWEKELHTIHGSTAKLAVE